MARLCSQYKLDQALFDHDKFHTVVLASIGMCMGNLHMLVNEAYEPLLRSAEAEGCGECNIAEWRDYVHEQIDNIKPYTSFT